MAAEVIPSGPAPDNYAVGIEAFEERIVLLTTVIG